MALLLARKAAALLAKILARTRFAAPFARHLWQIGVPNLNFRIRLASA
jgi:hypothetical protein